MTPQNRWLFRQAGLIRSHAVLAAGWPSWSPAASEQIEVEVRANQRTEVVWRFDEEQPGSDASPGRGDRFVAGDPTFADLP